MALALVTTWLANRGKLRFAWVTLLPMAFVVTTTLTAGSMLVGSQFPDRIARGRALGDNTLIVQG
jgi:carbon starvation protein